MRLWHESLISKLPRLQLIGQWRECIALLGKGWGRKHSIVDYVFEYDKDKLASFTYLVALEMLKRGYKPKLDYLVNFYITKYSDLIYLEHDDKYLEECLDNLAKKGIIIQ